MTLRLRQSHFAIATALVVTSVGFQNCSRSFRSANANLEGTSVSSVDSKNFIVSSMTRASESVQAVGQSNDADLILKQINLLIELRSDLEFLDLTRSADDLISMRSSALTEISALIDQYSDRYVKLTGKSPPLSSVTGVPPPVGDQPVAGVPPPVQDRPVSGVPPVQDRPVSGVPPVQDRPVSGVPPVDNKPVTGVPPPTQDKPVNGLPPVPPLPVTGVPPPVKALFTP